MEIVFISQMTTLYELYAVIEPTVNKNSIITIVNKLLGWIKKEDDSLFINNAPTF